MAHGIMTDIAETLFFMSIAWLATHELDAIQHDEWRIFFHRLPVDDLTAYRLFVALHVPLFALMVAWSREPAFQIAFSAFLIVHAGLHWFFRGHPAYEFRGWFSNLIIFGGAPLGGAAPADALAVVNASVSHIQACRGG